ncbi:hypothetical protein EC844_12061 [Acinetobacter calcoaceticus]|uniref:Uncharacterized protein n=1 Tax=Acinetobacter calcoaceticus TaxID=471 RepID=A0A4R1XIH8_ACICA|nr:hypothetical protein EC844_12061 [Acinetobacter calcoaceticus]
MRSKKLKLGAVIALTAMLNGCATLSTMGNIDHDPSYKVKNLYKDQLIAYGMPKQPVTDYENALVILGTKNNYLIEPAGSVVNQHILLDLVTQLDLKYLSIASVENVLSKNFQITLQNPESVLSDLMLIQYEKPLQQISAKEKQLLGSLKFDCKETISNQMQFYACSQQLNYNIYPIKKTENHQALQHAFRQPIQFEVNQKVKSSQLKNVPYYMLLPLTVVVDIVTLPIQLIGFSQAMSQGH